ncbi:type I DNA topoisomerase [Blattabacterium cuenoti]|uniref:type I DNA topoisomerase n=1 Tax=Blattabacterium cuenoti TaxID=1653831 RepID=UPI00163BF563|nr:type I DNA topoisomerase [Blattabacterium cuenoti]
MKKNLVIVESPTKAKTIQKFLGNNYHVISSYGHIMDLPEKKLGIQIENNFTPDYVILNKKKKIVNNIKKLIKDFNIIWIASDEDREGESIAYQIKKIFFSPEKIYKRIVFNEVTKNAIIKSINNPRSLNFNLIYAQQARRIIDRLVGFKLSPLLWKKIKPKLSAGRVQSIAVRLIVERENKIKNIIPIKTFKINGIFKKDDQIIYTKFNENIENKRKVKELMKSFINNNFFVEKIIENIEKKSPSYPFTTSSLQQESFNKLRFSISKTMFLAQELYEKGYITYIRTDSQKLSSIIISEIKKYVLNTYGDKYLSIRVNKSSNKKFSQESHEAIRPTVINYDSSYLKLLNKNEKMLYKLIWNRTIMSQMKDAIFRKKFFYIKFSNLNNFFIGNDKIIEFDGFMKIKNIDKNNLFSLKIKKGSSLERVEIIAKQIIKNNSHRYNESSLVKDLENLGIGRPSTYVPIISTIKNKNYVNIQKIIKEKNFYEIFILKEKSNVISNINENKIRIERNKFIPTEIGTIITNFLKKYFKEIVNYNFTADLEKKFDDVSKGNLSWTSVIQDFYKNFEKKLFYVNNNVKKIYNKHYIGIDPKSNKKIFTRIAKFGPVIQLGDFEKNKEKPKFFPLLNNHKIDSISLNNAINIINLPRSIGFFRKKEILLKMNKYNVYIKYNNKLIPIEKEEFFNNKINLKKAINIINNFEKKTVSDQNTFDLNK